MSWVYQNVESVVLNEEMRAKWSNAQSRQSAVIKAEKFTLGQNITSRSHFWNIYANTALTAEPHTLERCLCASHKAGLYSPALRLCWLLLRLINFHSNRRDFMDGKWEEMVSFIVRISHAALTSHKCWTRRCNERAVRKDKGEKPSSPRLCSNWLFSASQSNHLGVLWQKH